MRNLVYHSTDKNKGSLRIITAIDYHVFRKHKSANFARVAARVKYFRDNKTSIEFHGPAFVKYQKMRFLATLRRTTFYISLFQRLGGRDIA